MNRKMGIALAHRICSEGQALGTSQHDLLVVSSVAHVFSFHFFTVIVCFMSALERLGGM